MSHGCGQLSALFRELRRYSLTLLFLAAYPLCNDGVQAMIVRASVHGSEGRGPDGTALIGAVLLVRVLAAAGALLGRHAARHGAKRTLLAHRRCGR
ncbi:MFS transporter [Streptomyces albus subsp. chlorinus]|uniref:MFS transporter n=1 Tax=Streptomyces albus TaxID=1888 RepID=UPI0031F61C16